MYTLATAIQDCVPVIRFSQFLSRRVLTILRATFLTVSILCGIGGVVVWLYVPGVPYTFLFGVSLITGALWLEQMMLYAYHNSYFFHGMNSVLGIADEPVSGATYEIVEALMNYQDDVTKGFCLSRLGSEILLRAGIDPNHVADFLNGQRPRISTMMIPLSATELFSFLDLGRYLLVQDPAFKQLLKRDGVTEEMFIGALTWIINAHHREKRSARWWGKDALSKTTGVGREWSYGTPYLLERFSRNLRTGAVYANLGGGNSAFKDEKIIEIETALARAKAANVLLIGEAGVGKIDLILAVEDRLARGAAVGAVSEQRLIMLDTARLFAVHRDKQSFETTVLTIFNEAVKAGGIIIVIENLSTFVREAEALGVFIPELLDPYLASPSVHVIGTDTPGAYHTYLEPLGAFSRRFAEVLIDTPDLSSTTRVLEGIALENEGRYNVLFTYPALTTITTAADRYLVEGVMPDKAIELLVDIATRARSGGVSTITAEYVFEVVSDKTGIPVGPINEDERDLLLHLEDKLHERVIGQQRALDAIARTMRRARAGIQSADKPIGSFLFLGPTGVGKTETAKALAHIFFGNESNMHRIDMSEFSGADALSRLIGDGVHTGVLSDMLREHPYSVLLLDEFEKGARAVHDIFLQVLDEGVFTDARGEKINARNTIVIATSNAGSKLILETVAQRKELATLTQEIINFIVKEGVYRPELINRFDSTIIFEPLTLEEQGQIAGLMLGGLYQRIKERGYELTINRDLMDLLVAKGYSPEFGARPMQRVLQDVVEEKVAERIISGAAQPGDTITLSLSDFTELELAV
jgi:ATP-dependent Clp protease ATP-binding subunit ClpC